MQCLVLSRCLSTLERVSQAADEHKASALLCRAGVTHRAWGRFVQPRHAQCALITHATTRYPVPPSPSSPDWETLQLDSQAFLDSSQEQPFKGKSFKAQETTASSQFHGLIPKAVLLVSSAGLDVTKTATPPKPTLLVCHKARKFHHVPREALWLGMLKTPARLV